MQALVLLPMLKLFGHWVTSRVRYMQPAAERLSQVTPYIVQNLATISLFPGKKGFCSYVSMQAMGGSRRRNLASSFLSEKGSAFKAKFPQSPDVLFSLERLYVSTRPLHIH